MTSLIYCTDMEEMKSLGFVQLFKNPSYNNFVITADSGELFIERVFGKLIFKIKFNDIYYALPLIWENDWVRINTEHYSRYFKSEILKYYIDSFREANENK